MIVFCAGERRSKIALVLCLLVGMLWCPEVVLSQTGQGNVYVVLVGISRYKDRRITRLKYTERDVWGLYRVLTRYGRVPRRNIKVLVGRRATKWQIIRTLRSWLRKKVGPNDTALVYFSGHGGLGSDDLTYWITYDTRYGQVEQTGLDHERINVLLRKLRSQRTVLLVDACHSGFAMKGMKSGGSFSGAKYRGQGRVVIASSRQSQYSVEHKKVKHGVFSYVLMEALKGQADGDRDGVVTLLEMWSYLFPRVKRLAVQLKNYPQTPVFFGALTGSIPLSFPKPQKPPVPKQEEKKGWLRIGSVPSGASVEVGGVDMGETPLRVGVKAGVVEVKVSLRGYKVWKRRLMVFAGRERRKVLRLAQETRASEPGAKRPVRREPPARRESSHVGSLEPMRRALQAGTVRSIRGLLGAKRVWIPAGRFVMGSNRGDRDEKPKHQARISRGFWMMQTEVTQGQYKKLMGRNPSRCKNCGLNCPVENVSWNDAALFANRLSDRSRPRLEKCFVCRRGKCRAKSHRRYLSCKGWRLPTEAEWEYAAKAGTIWARYGSLDKIAWWGAFSGGNSRDSTKSVRGKKANRWGLYDMLGNVWEWVYDRYGKYSLGAVIDPVGPSSGWLRVYRGGSWNVSARYVRATKRSRNVPRRHFNALGFRLVRGGHD